MRSLTERRPPAWPPPGAVAWGDDRYGLWAEYRFGGVVQRMRWVEPGEFLMGSPDAEPQRWDDEGPRHLVRLTEGFWLADSACTQAMWEAVMGQNPSDFKGEPELPVEQVSWDDVQRFLVRVQEQLPAGMQAELPTEAQWEYACRADTNTPFSLGDNIDPSVVNYDGNRPYAGGAKGAFRKCTVPVKSLPPNGWGLHEMHGNVWEWCADGLRKYTVEPQQDPVGPGGGDRVVRGGSCTHDGRGCRSAERGALQPGDASGYLGFRLALRSMAKSGPAEDAERPSGFEAGGARRVVSRRPGGAGSQVLKRE
jgi:formylglycine-generating enzyme